jgi:hypothetical protein
MLNELMCLTTPMSNGGLASRFLLTLDPMAER